MQFSVDSCILNDNISVRIIFRKGADPTELIREIAYHQTGRLPSLRHNHTDSDSLEVLQIVSGDGNALIADRTYPLLPGTLLFIDAAHVHSLNPRNEEIYCRNKLIVTRSVFESILISIGAESLLRVFSLEGGCCFSFPADRTSEIDRLYYELDQTTESQSGVALSVLLQLIRIGEAHQQPELAEGDIRVSTALHYLHTHFSEPITVDRIAEDTHLSKFYLCRLFHAHTGMSLMQYLNEQRLTTARRMLTQTDRSITSIAQDCGFGSASHFCAAFHAREGMSPRAFRKRYRK